MSGYHTPAHPVVLRLVLSLPFVVANVLRPCKVGEDLVFRAGFWGVPGFSVAMDAGRITRRQRPPAALAHAVAQNASTSHPPPFFLVAFMIPTNLNGNKEAATLIFTLASSSQ